MRFTNLDNRTHLTFFAMLLFLSFSFYLACSSGGGSKPEAETAVLPSAAVPITISPVVPSDIDITGGAPNATLSQAAVFAWQEFIALNWPALPGQRDVPNTNALFGAPNEKVLVWHTFRHKVEIFPGNGQPPHGASQGPPDYGYNTPPQYFYDPSQTGTSDGQVAPCGTPSTSTPWINLDEVNEIGVANMFSGGAPANPFPGQQILFLAKANKAEYVYATQNGWNIKLNPTAAANTKSYIQQNSNTPPPGTPGLVSLPYGTIEAKTGWRRLTDKEKQSGRFFSTTVRYYQTNPSTQKPCYVDETFGMVALHIIQKTPTAPYFIFASFEQADNLLTTSGSPVEDSDGNVIANNNLLPLNPYFKVTNATPTTPQTFSPTTANSTPGSSLYYQNTPGEGLPTGTVTINKRLHPIPPEVIAANQAAHQAIAAYNKQNGINSPWPFYKLVNVQYQPIQKTPGVNYTGVDSATYYMANSVVESDYILQKFSGTFSSQNLTITDYNANGTVAYNAYHNGKFLMGGCMGCHGNATNAGSDYSFILKNGAVDAPEVASPPGQTLNINSKKLKSFLELFQK
ncbi:MAG: hypothetical protein ACKVT2_06410 [Saprospiraceae bacterium]